MAPRNTVRRQVKCAGLLLLSLFTTGYAAPGLARPTVKLTPVPATYSLLPGGTATYTIIVSQPGDKAGKVALSLAGLPAGAEATFTPSSVEGAWAVASLTISTSRSVPARAYPLRVKAMAGRIPSVAPVHLDIRSGMSFTHPGILLDAAQLEQMAAQANAGSTVGSTALSNTQDSDFGTRNYQPTPLSAVDADDTAQASAIRNDAIAAYTQALLWYITRDATYAQTAIAIMNAWSSTFSNGFSGNDQANLASWTGDIWPRAAEIIRWTYLKSDQTSQWDEASIEAFQQMLAQQFQPLVTPGRPYGNYGGNLNASSAAAAIHIGIFNNDAATFLRGIDMWRATLPAYIYAAGDGAYPAPPLNWTAEESTPAQITKLWFNPSLFTAGLSEETCRDLGHVRWGLAALANAAESARIQGMDLVGESSLGTPNTRRIATGLELDASYLNNSPAAPSGLCQASIDLGSSVATGEIFYNDLVDRRGFRLPQMNTYLQHQRPTGASYFMDWETLSHYANP